MARISPPLFAAKLSAPSAAPATLLPPAENEVMRTELVSPSNDAPPQRSPSGKGPVVQAFRWYLAFVLGALLLGGPLAGRVWAQPPWDTCANAYNLNTFQEGLNYVFSLTGATPTTGLPGSCNNGAYDIWWKYTASANRDLLLIVQPYQFAVTPSVGLSVYTGCPSSGGQLLECGLYEPSENSLVVPMTAGTTYYIRALSSSNASGNIFMNFYTSIAPGQHCDTAPEVTPGTTYYSSNLGADNAPGGDATCQSASHDIYYKYTPPQAQTVTVTAFSPVIDVTMSVHPECPLQIGDDIECAFGGPNGGPSYSFPAQGGFTYYFRLAGTDDAQGQINFTLNAVNEPDCNGNGIPDYQDIADGTSTDCDGDGVPDSCEINVYTDCNHNNILDRCEIASNPSLDANNDQILDTCESGVVRNPTNLDDLGTVSFPKGNTVTGTNANEETAYDLSDVGDVDGDGYDDLLAVSANSTAYLLFGPIDQNITFDPATYPDAMVKFVGFSASSNPLTGAGAGDVNGDGYDDFLIGVRGATVNGNTYAGRTWLIYGRARPPQGQGFPATIGQVDVTSLDASNAVRIEGGQQNGYSGYSVDGAGDVNGDGFDDVVIGAEGENGTDGAAYVIFGSSTGIGSGGVLDLRTIGSVQDNGISGVRIDGTPLGQVNLGLAVAGAGDVNGDGYDDFLVSDLSSGGDSVYLVYGAAQDDQGIGIGVRGTLDPTNLVADTNNDGVPDHVFGVHIHGFSLGFAVVSLSTAGDVNDDGFADILIGDTIFGGSPSQPGGAYLIYGASAGLGSNADLNVSKLNGTNGIILRGEGAGLAGWSVAGAGDLDGDGYSDILVGDPFINANGVSGAGKAYLVMGRSRLGTGNSFDLSSVDGDSGAQLLGGTAYEDAGWSVSGAGDFDGDGISDFAVGAFGFQPTSPPGLGTAGRAYILSGRKLSDVGIYHSRMRHGMGQNIGTLPTFLTVPPRPVGPAGDGGQDIPLSRVEIGFKGGQTGTHQPSLQTVELHRTPVPNPYLFNPGTPGQIQFKTLPVFWKVSTDRADFDEATLIFHYKESDTSALSQDEIDALGVFYSSVDPNDQNTTPTQLATSWFPMIATHDPVNHTLTVHLTGLYDANNPFNGQNKVNGYYGIFAGEVKYDLASEIVPSSRVDVSRLPNSGPIVIPSDAAFWHEKSHKLYATKAYSTVIIQWIDGNDPSIKMDTTIASFVWPGSRGGPFDGTNPDYYQYFVAGAGKVHLTDAADDEGNTTKYVEVRDTETDIDVNQLKNTGDFAPTKTGRTLLLLSNNTDPLNNDIYFQFVWTVPFDYPNYKFTDSIPVGTDVGLWEMPGEGYRPHDLDAGEPYLMNDFPYYCAQTGYYDRTKAPQTGPLIPVNTNTSTPDGNDIRVAMYQRGEKMFDPTVAFKRTTFHIYWPYQPVEFTVIWPPEVPIEDTIVIASQLGSGPLTPDKYYDPQLYWQNDPGAIGFNPNDEHAVGILENEGMNFYALRDDLGRPDTSQPFVLVKYKDVENTDQPLRPEIKLFKVVATNDQYSFYYSNPVNYVGDRIEPPFPLRSSMFLPCPPSQTGATDGNYTSTPGTVFQDRTGAFWVKDAGPRDDSASSVTMHYFYPLQPSFYMPDDYKTALLTKTGIYASDETFPPGTCIPWLDDWTSPTLVGQPVAVSFKATWPVDAPILFAGETLVDPKRGLPGISGADSVDLLSQQSLEKGQGESVELIDPTRARWIPFAQTDLPPEIKTARVKGLLEFEDLPPHIRRRFKYDDNAQRLIFFGQYIRFVTGDNMLLPNIMTSRERDVILGLSSNATFQAAVQKLYDKTQPILKIAPTGFLPNSVDSASGKVYMGAGYVDGDGYPDIVAVLGSSIVWYKNVNGDGTTWTQYPVGTLSNANIIGFQVADIDKDGDADIVYTTSDGNIYAVFNTSAGTSWNPVQVNSDPVVGLSHLALGDLDGDGKLDVVVTTLAGVQWYWQQTATPGWDEFEFPTAKPPVAVTVGDVNGDGFKDIVAAYNESPTESTIVWYKNDGTPLQQAAGDWLATPIGVKAVNNASALVVVDLDQDNDADVVVASSGDNSIRWFANLDGAGTTWSPQDVSHSAGGVRDIRVIDVDHDGDLDVVSADAGDNQLAWHENVGVSGHPAFETHPIPATVAAVSGLALADLNGDSYADILPSDYIDAARGLAWYASDGASRSIWDSLALTAAVGQGTGFVTLAFNNTPDSKGAVTVEVIRVDCPLYQGDIKIMYPDCPFGDQVALRHSGDFAGQADHYRFDWKYMDSATYLDILTHTGTAPTPDDTNWVDFTPNPADQVGAVDIDLNGAGNAEFVLTDKFWIVRYEPVDLQTAVCPDWSQWTKIGLTEGWVKRVVGDFGPYRQRATGGGIQGAEDNFVNYTNRTVNTVVSMIEQAGKRWEGNVPLTCNNVDSLGLIEVYQSVLNQAEKLSIDAAPRRDLDKNGDGIPDAGASAGVSNALLLAAGRIADLYALLGNEAYADAADPTIAFGTNDAVFGPIATSIHCFMNQTSSLLEEELDLLRGRDDTSLPDVHTPPVYNRLIWNFTNDITGGEVAYALNYAISDQNGDGLINEADAALMYPQGHGDAWGDYLSAIKAYYQLIRHPEFAWVPRTEPVLVGGATVEVDYFDERKFAQLSADLARTGAQIVNLTYRAFYDADPSKQWQGYKDTVPGRYWGVSEWASRAGQGAYFNWITANALLPPDNGNLDPRSIRKVDRNSVKELQEIAAGYAQIQQKIDEADAGLNPLGLARNVVPFDINPALLTNGLHSETHFEQVYDRASQALANSVRAFDYASAATLALRKQADDVSDFQTNVQDREIDFKNRLIEVFGSPYPDDIGAGKTYPQGYDGPDLVHWGYFDPSQLADLGVINLNYHSVDVTLKKDITYSELVDNLTYDFTDDQLQDNPNFTPPPTTVGTNVTIHYQFTDQFGLTRPASWTAPRKVYGEIQQDQLDMMKAIREFQKKADDYSGFVSQVEDTAKLIEAKYNVTANDIKIINANRATQSSLSAAILAAKIAETAFSETKTTTKDLSKAAQEALPKVVGFSNDISSPIRATIGIATTATNDVLNGLEKAAGLLGEGLSFAKDEVQRQTDISLEVNNDAYDIQEAVAGMRNLLLNESTLRYELLAAEQDITQATMKYKNALAKGQQLIDARNRFRAQTAAKTQAYRYKDMAFRIFRDEGVQKFRASFDLASRFAYLAAKAYDYETDLLGSDTRGPGQEFLAGIVRAQALGQISPDGVPLVGGDTGDPGLADPMARMKQNWDLVLKNQLGFNNPQTETNRFSLRRELFRVGLEADAEQNPKLGDTDAIWRNLLSRPYGGPNHSGLVKDIFALPEFQRYAIPFTSEPSDPLQADEPAIVIRFGTNINFAKNFFVNEDRGGPWPLGAGDSSYDTTNFATKIRSVGTWFVNYNTLTGSGMSNTPRVYLFPVGDDIMRSPTGNRGQIRTFHVLDQAIPAPFPVGGSQLSDPNWVPIFDTLSEGFVTLRRFPSFRAYHSDTSYLNNPDELDTSQLNYDSRLIGRSVWNTDWMLIIPGGTLHSDRWEGIRRFIYGRLGTAADGSYVLDDQGNQRDGNGVKDILIFFQTYAYSGI